jgi:hypothetical protein
MATDSWSGNQRWLTVALVLFAGIGAALEQMEWIPAVARTANPEAVTEVKQMVLRSDGPVAIGYGPAYRLSFLRPLPVFMGQPYQIDAVALMDLRASGESTPPGLLSSVADCRIRTWLIPRGGEPFDLRSAYDSRVPVFGSDFIDTFKASYRRTEQGTYFDVWVRVAPIAPDSTPSTRLRSRPPSARHRQ